LGASLLALLAAVSIWLSLGSVAILGGDTSRIAALPSFWILGVLAVAAIAAARIAKLRLDQAWPLAISLILWLPFVPGHVPPAFLLWEGPVEAIVWLCVIVGLIVARKPTLSRPLSDPALAPWIAATILIVSWLVVFSQIRGVIPGGDEPHYLAATQSLLHDGDLRVANNYASGEYLDYFPGKLEPHFLARAKSGEIYSIHAPGVSVIVLPAFAIAGYAGAVSTMLLIAALTAALTWRLAFRVSGDAAGAWAGTMAVFASTPYFFHAFTVYPEIIGSFCVMCGAWLLIELADGRQVATRSFVAVGAALAILPWLHSRFAILAAMIGLLVVVRLARRGASIDIAKFLGVPVAAGIAWFAYFYVIWGSPSPAAPYGADTSTSASYIVRGLIGLIVDQQFGVLTTAPIYVMAIAGMVLMFVRRRALATELTLIVAPYAIAVASYAMWWAGAAAPARFLVSVLPLAALPIALVWPKSRVIAGVLLLISSALIVPRGFVEGGRFIYNNRSGVDATLQWLTSSFDLPSAVPSVHRSGGAIAIRDALLWSVAAGVAAAFAIAATRKRQAGLRFAVAAPSMAIAVTLACGWHAHLDSDRSKLSAVSRLRDWHTTLVDLTAMRSLPRPDWLNAMTIEVRPGQRLNRLGAGEYLVRAGAPGLTWSVGRNDPPFESPPPEHVRIPVTLQTLNASSAFTLTPISVVAPASRRNAVRAARYGHARVFFVDDWAYLERDGIWTRANGTTEIVVDSDERNGEGLPISITGGAVATTVTVSTGDWHASVSLNPGQKQELLLPPTSRGIWPIRITSGPGFRPSEREPGNADVRSLAAWIAILR
jgi:hypothetical protein